LRSAIHSFPLLCAFAGVAALLAPAYAHAERPQPMSCADLVQLDLPDTRMVSATEIPAGPFPYGSTAPTCASPIASPNLPAHCRVIGVVAPSITFEVWLPLENWNGKFQAFGNHGFAGEIDYSDLGPELVKGYAIASTDAGHAGPDPLPWMQNEQQIIDYGHRGVHEMTLKSKEVVRAFYGRKPKYSYFNGCSTGGKEGLMEAQRYPEDYDGIVVGHPNFDQIGNRAQYVWNGQATFGASPAAPLAGAKLTLINNAATAACDALDGVVDGVIDDPRSCPFQPMSLLCAAGQDPATCLTQIEVTALAKVYAGPRNPRTGESIYPGLVKGSERGWGGHTAGPNIFATADQFFKFMVFKDPSWDYRTFDFDADIAYAVNNFGHIVNATSPDLRAFEKNGGKILHYHSYRSTTHTAPKSIEYYEEVAAFMNHRRRGELKANDLRKTQDFYRLFMAPGGSGNKGPEKFDPLPYLERWVEQGMAPDRIIASNFTAGVVDRTRPLCPHPQVAVYKGSGSIDAAENFVCRNK
jgi:feruloyl esterase